MKVLVVDDDLGSRLVAQATVESLGHTCVTAVDGDEAWTRFLEDRPDVLVTDREMPGIDGVDLCRRVRAQESGRYTYVVLVTAHDAPSDVRGGMLAGADDYVTKPLDPFALETRLIAAARVTELHRELAAARDELARQARVDPLTGLFNRLRLNEDLAELDQLARRYGPAYSLALCDVDHFKRYNDTYGHGAGDDALRAVAATLQAHARGADRVYRYGGEEFLVVLPEQTGDAARVALDRARQAVADLAVEHRAGGPEGVVTISVGVAAAEPNDTPYDVVARADAALYSAKDRGRNHVSVSTGPSGA